MFLTAVSASVAIESFLGGAMAGISLITLGSKTGRKKR